MDVWEYFQQREAECGRLSLAPDTSFEEMFGEEKGSNGERGMMWGRLVLSPRAFLEVFESIVVIDNSIRREEYSYYLIVDGYEVWGYDRDPDHDPCEHMHRGSDHSRHPSDRKEFHEVVEEAWETLSQEERLGSWAAE